MRRLAFLAALTLCACPGKKQGSTTTNTAGMPAAVKTYGALRWVPATASYAFVARRSADLSLLLRDAADSLGIAFDADAEVAADWSREMFGYDLFSPDSLEGIGVDLDAGAAIWGTGLSPTVAVRLSDPSKLDAFVDRMRSAGVSLQSQMSDGVEVFSVPMDRELIISWAVVDGWVLSRLELTRERAPELGWLAGARGARGALGGDPDFTAAVDVAKTHAPSIAAGDGPPVVAVLRPARLADAVEGFIDVGGIDLHACLAPLRSLPRILGVAASGDAGVTGALVADLGDPAPLANLVVTPPPGWAAAREGAAVQVDLSIDAEATLHAVRACVPAREARSTFGVKTAHLAVHQFDDDGFPGVAAGYADLSTDRHLKALIPPAIKWISDSRKVGKETVIDVSIPYMFSISYLLTPTRAAIGRGDGEIERVLGPGEPLDGELFHLHVRPRDVPDRSWGILLERLDVARETARERAIARIRRWKEITIHGELEGARAVMTVTATRHE